MDIGTVMAELEVMGNGNTKEILKRHGARESFFGVKVGDLKKIVKKVGKNHSLSLELYNTGNSDAMYLAGLIADERQISKEELRNWADKAYWYMLSEYTVPWVAAESPHGWDLGQEWIASEDPKIAACGWSTLANWANIRPDAELDIEAYRAHLGHIVENLQKSPNRVRYTMNGFVITVGGSIRALTENALATADQVGKVDCELGSTNCKVPAARPYIQKMMDKGRIGKKKKKKARC